MQTDISNVFIIAGHWKSLKLYEINQRPNHV
jgi:hypothetical protein